MSWKSAFIGIGQKFGGRTRTLAVMAALIAAAVVAGLWVWPRDPKVTGSTSAERIESITRLAAERAPGAGKAIAGAATGDPDPQVRCVALVSLRKYAGPEARPAVEQGMSDNVPKVRAAAARALGMYADSAAAKRLGDVLQTDRDEEVRLAAARGLARCNSDEADDLLVSAMKTNNSPAVQKRALKLLLEGTGVRLTPEPDPANAEAWAGHLRNVLSHIEVTRAANEPRRRRGPRVER